MAKKLFNFKIMKRILDIILFIWFVSLVKYLHAHDCLHMKYSDYATD